MHKPLRPDELPRYASEERLLHWLTVVAFACVAASGLAFFHPSLYFLSFVLGGGPWSVVLHPFAGLVMVLCFYGLARRLWRDNRIEPRDRAWLRGIDKVLSDDAAALPEAGRFNGGQKLLFHAMTLCLALLLLTGFVIWRAYFSGYFAILVIRWSVLLHALAAFALVAAVIGHVAAAAWVRGSFTAMTRGSVTLGWAFKHHRDWFREMVRPTSGR